MRDYRLPAANAWMLLLATYVVACIPWYGFLIWLFAVPVLIATLVMSILVLMRGGKSEGIALLVSTVVIAPVIIIAGPFVAATVMEAVGRSS